MELKKVSLSVLALIVVSFSFGSFIYMKEKSGICVIDLPPKPFVDSETGKKYYIGDQNHSIKKICSGGSLFEPIQLSELNLSEYHN